MSDKEELISIDTAWEVVKYFTSMNNTNGYGMSYLNPELVSAKMKDITMNPVTPTDSSLATAMKDPKSNEKELQSFSQDFELKSMVYKRLISYMANMLSFDITYTSNAKLEDYKTPKYAKDLSSVENFLDEFNYKKEFRTILKQMVKNDAFFGCFIDTPQGYAIQELPSDYCKITGRWANGFLFSFNMYWFLLPGVDIDMYPEFFKKKYAELWGKGQKQRGYDPSLSPELRGKSQWIYWVDIPIDVGVCFKLSPEVATRLPYFAPLFNDLILQPFMRELQKNANIASASKMLVGQVPYLNSDSKASMRDNVAISPELLGKFMALARSGIDESIRIASFPLEDMQAMSFDSKSDIYENYVKTALALSGVNTNLIFTSDIKPNAIETQLSLDVDIQMMNILYEQFNEFMNYYANKKTKNFKFNFVFEGTDFGIERAARLKNALNLLDKGIALPHKIAAAMGMKPSQLRKQMEESKATDFVDSLQSPAFVQQMKVLKEQSKMNQAIQESAPKVPISKPKTSGKGRGAPKKDSGELSENGMNTRETAGNIGRGGTSV